MGSHHLPFSALKPQNVSENGYRVRATKENFPALRGMSLYKLVLESKGVREPHWHANADELGYCLKGEVLVSFFGNGNTKESFLVAKGETFLIPSGFFHTIENRGEGTAELLLQFSHEEPEDFELSAAFGMFSNAVLGNTWGVPSTHFASIKRPIKGPFIARVEKERPLSKEEHYRSKYQYSLETSAPLIANEGGDAKVARHDVWPALHRQALYSLRLTKEGMREPHWHPETAEMGYVASGRGRMSILSPSGAIDTYEMGEGDLYFIPKAYPHHIENLGEKDLHLLIFFDQAMPQDIGFTGSIKSFSDEILAAVLGGTKETFAKLPTVYEDLFIVKRGSHDRDYTSPNYSTEH